MNIEDNPKLKEFIDNWTKMTNVEFQELMENIRKDELIDGGKDGDVFPDDYEVKHFKSKRIEVLAKVVYHWWKRLPREQKRDETYFQINPFDDLAIDSFKALINKDLNIVNQVIQKYKDTQYYPQILKISYICNVLKVKIQVLSDTNHKNL